MRVHGRIPLLVGLEQHLALRTPNVFHVRVERSLAVRGEGNALAFRRPVGVQVECLVKRESG